jgi:hypothetical protein
VANYPQGFFTLVGYQGREYLCYRCDRCGLTVHDIPKNMVNYRGEKVNTIWCCGKQIPVGKPRTTVRLSTPRGSNAVDLNAPMRIGSVVIGQV